MTQIAPHMRMLVAFEPTDFRAGIDGLSFVAYALSPRHGSVFL